MKMLKTYWLELLFFAVGLVGAVIAMPFLPASVPLQFQGDGVITRTGPKWAVFIIPVVQLLVCYGFHWWIGRCLEKLPALAHTLAGMERLLPAVLSIILLTLELCVLAGRLGRDGPCGHRDAHRAAAGAHCVHRLCSRENPGQHRQTEITAGRLGGCSHRRGRAVR